MMNITINNKKLSGVVKVPSSKSLSHRALISACLAGEGIVDNLIYSNDIDATMNCMRSLGFDFITNDNAVKVIKTDKFNDNMNCQESGSTVRFLIPVAMSIVDSMTFHGENNLVKRPLSIYLDIFNKYGIPYEKGIDELPLTVKGKLKSGNFDVLGNISSQFITGLLLSLPLLDGDSTIKIIGNLESKGYVDLTLDVLSKFGIEIINNNYNSFEIKGNQQYKPCDYFVEGDFSQAAFWLVYSTLNGGIELDGMNINSLQGDKEIIDFIHAMGGEVVFDKYLTARKCNTHGAIIDLKQAPDLGPIMTVLACLSEGETRIINAQRLRIKESDRIKAMTTELNKLGANIIETEDGMIINGVKELTGGTVDSWNDHRIVMALAVASSRASGKVTITNCEAINKSYPHFFEQFKGLGGDTFEFE